MDSFNDEQRGAFEKVVKNSASIFLTGCGGTGKSFVVEKIVEKLHEDNNAKSVAVTAMTGVAAFNIGGTTLHSFAGIGLGHEDKESLAKRVQFNRNAKERWRKTKVLIVDEISMMSGNLFDKLEYIARKVRNKDMPFGGIQLVVIGDLLQLPPIDDTDNREPRVFESKSWNSCISEYVVLRKVIRQSDSSFIKLLTCIRLGYIDDSVTELMEKMSQPKEYDIDCKPVNLYPTRAETDYRNTAELDLLGGEAVVYEAEDQVQTKFGGQKLLESCPAPGEVVLKKDAQVMLVKNLSQTLVNGTVGIITGFVNVKLRDAEVSYSVPVVRFMLADGRVVTKHLFKETWTIGNSEQGTVSRTQIPLILAWAITIHKSQGKTIQHLKVDLSRSFAPGQIYTALSRAVGLDTLEVSGFRKDLLKVDTKSLKFCIDNDLV